jgi:hypothetical protein
MNWSTMAVAGSGVEIKLLSHEEASRQTKMRSGNWEDAIIDVVRVAER